MDVFVLVIVFVYSLLVYLNRGSATLTSDLVAINRTAGALTFLLSPFTFHLSSYFHHRYSGAAESDVLIAGRLHLRYGVQVLAY